MLGKRKRTTVVSRNKEADFEDTASPEAGGAHVDDVFRKYFETRFVPLPQPTFVTGTSPEQGNEEGYGVPEEDSESLGSTSSVWSGISDEGHETKMVEVVDHAGPARSEIDDPIDRIFQRSFMVC